MVEMNLYTMSFIFKIKIIAVIQIFETCKRKAILIYFYIYWTAYHYILSINHCLRHCNHDCIHVYVILIIVNDFDHC